MQTSHGREGGMGVHIHVYGDLPQWRELSMLQRDEDMEMWYGIWEASVMTSSHRSGRHAVHLY